VHTIRTTNVNYNERSTQNNSGYGGVLAKLIIISPYVMTVQFPLFFHIKLPIFPFLILATAWLLGPCVHWTAISLRLRQTRMKWRCLCEEEAASRLSPVPVCWKKGIGVEALFWWVRWWAAFAFLVRYLISRVAVCGLV
jgi:hypothetical protein